MFEPAALAAALGAPPNVDRVDASNLDNDSEQDPAYEREDGGAF